jgi:hypothetical protein
MRKVLTKAPRRRKTTTTVSSNSSASENFPEDDVHGNRKQAEFCADSDTLSLPSMKYTATDAVKTQLVALQHNDHPRVDAGVLSLYRFSSFDPMVRSDFFVDRRFDLGQFERFRKVLKSESDFSPLVNSRSWHILSVLSLSDDAVAVRVLVHPFAAVESQPARFCFTLKQAFGGAKDGIWLTRSLGRERELEGNADLPS